MRVLEDAAGPVQAGQQPGPPPGACPEGQALLAGEGLRALPEVFGTEQLAADGAGEQILAGAGSAWDEAEQEAGPPERSDRGNLGWEAGGWSGNGNLIAAGNFARPLALPLQRVTGERSSGRLSPPS
ncbi:MAG: hypothetical protein ACOY71_12350 [Gemmatimonadota bacterium]